MTTTQLTIAVILLAVFDVILVISQVLAREEVKNLDSRYISLISKLVYQNKKLSDKAEALEEQAEIICTTLGSHTEDLETCHRILTNHAQKMNMHAFNNEPITKNAGVKQ